MALHAGTVPGVLPRIVAINQPNDRSLRYPHYQMYYRTLLVYLCLDHVNIAPVIGLDCHPDVPLPSPVMPWYQRLKEDVDLGVEKPKNVHLYVGCDLNLGHC